MLSGLNNIPPISSARLRSLSSAAAAGSSCCWNRMSSSSSMGTGSGSTKVVEFGRTHVVKPKGKHQATVVWLHGLGDQGSSWSQLLETLPLPNIKWICPTAPYRSVSIFGGFPSTAWFDVHDLNEQDPIDTVGLDAAAAHVANLLSAEPADIKLAIGGFSMGCATALYSASCYAHGKFGTGQPYPVTLSGVVGLSGWLPVASELKKKISNSEEAAKRAANLPLLLCHGQADDVVMYKFGEKSFQVFTDAGFKQATFKSYSRMGHHSRPEELEDVCRWFTATLGLEGL